MTAGTASDDAEADTDTAELHALVEGYARHADDGDGDAFAALFLPDAFLRTFPADGSEGQRHEGADALGRIPGRLREQYEATAHHVEPGAMTVTDDGATAAGSSACVAHHHRADGMDRVLTIRYDDTFGRDADGRWRFATRDVHMLRLDVVLISPPA